MKTLLFFLFLPLSLMGQDYKKITTEIVSVKLVDTLRVDGTYSKTYPVCTTITYEDPPKLDTVAVWIMCSDTSGNRKIASVSTMRGWEVRKPDDGYIPIYGPDPQHVAYLNYFKKPLTGYLIWGTRDVK